MIYETIAMDYSGDENEIFEFGMPLRAWLSQHSFCRRGCGCCLPGFLTVTKEIHEAAGFSLGFPSAIIVITRSSPES